MELDKEKLNCRPNAAEASINPTGSPGARMAFTIILNCGKGPRSVTPHQLVIGGGLFQGVRETWAGSSIECV